MGKREAPIHYTTRWLRQADIGPPTRDLMAKLYLDVYDGSTAELFLRDFQAKDGALLLFAGEELVGFTCLQMYRRNWQGREVQVIYSGDTVVQRVHWGQRALATDWLALMGQFHSENPDLPMIWFLLVKGHRTFLYLPVFARSYWPHPHGERGDLKELADFLASERYPEFYNPSSGLVEFPVSQGHLKAELAEPPQHQKRRAEVEFFLGRNPGYRVGHEMVCICEIEEANMKPLAVRAFRQGKERQPCRL